VPDQDNNFAIPNLFASQSPESRPLTIITENKIYGRVATNGEALNVSRARTPPQSLAAPSQIAPPSPNNPKTINLRGRLFGFSSLITSCRSASPGINQSLVVKATIKMITPITKA
jgi:hypothetical protein